MGMNTDACDLCCTSLMKAYDAAKENLSGVNQEVFLMEIGVGFQGFVEHFGNLSPNFVVGYY